MVVYKHGFLLLPLFSFCSCYYLNQLHFHLSIYFLCAFPSPFAHLHFLPTPIMQTTLLGLPNEILHVIAQALSIRDVLHFLSTCRQLYFLLLPHLEKLGLKDIEVGLTALQWAAQNGHETLANHALMTLTGDWGKCDCTRTVHFPLNTRTEKGRHRRLVLLTPLMRPKQGRNAPRNTAMKGKRWGPPCGLSTIAFVETRLKVGKVQSVAPTQGISPPLPPDNLPTAHSGLHSLRGFRQPLAPPTSWEVI